MLYAVRKPLEVKGVYSSAKKIAELRKKYPIGLSTRNFQNNQEEEALEWANVKGLGDAPQQVVPKVEKIKEVKSDVEILLNRLKKDGNYLGKLKLANETVWVTLEDMFYIAPNRCISEDYFFSQKRDSNWNYYNEFDIEKYQRYKNDLNRLNKTKIEYMKDGLFLNNYGEPTRNNNNRYEYPGKSRYIRYDAIVSIEWNGYWTLNGNCIKNKDIINQCKKDLK